MLFSCVIGSVVVHVFLMCAVVLRGTDSACFSMLIFLYEISYNYNLFNP